MSLIWFLLGLLVGILPTSWYYLQLNRQLQRLAKDLGRAPVFGSWARPDQLAVTLAAYRTRYQQLAGQVQDWEGIFKNAPIGYLQVDGENQLLWCNEIACQYLAIQRWQYSPPRLLLEVVRSYELDALVEQARNQQTHCERDWSFYPALELLPSPQQHASKLLRGEAFPLLDGQVGVFLENRQEVGQLVQQRERWVSDVAHELKTPLTSIRLVAEALQTRLEPPHRQWIDRLLNEAIRLSTLVQEFLDLSHLEGLPLRQLPLKPVNLTQLIKSAWVGLEPLASTKALTLNLQGPDHLVIQADEARLYRVFINLFDNSIKYSPPHQPIDVLISLPETLEQVASQVQIDLCDRGPGIPEADLPFVFERLYRADPSRTRHPVEAMAEGSSFAARPAVPSAGGSISAVQPGSGSGLGLAIVRQIVVAHHGSIVAKNHPVTGGAWLQICLPYTA